MDTKEKIENVWSIMHSINNDTQEINIGIEILGDEMDYLIKCGKFRSIKKIKEIPEGMEQRLGLLQEQIEELRKEITTLTKIKIIEELED